MSTSVGFSPFFLCGSERGRASPPSSEEHSLVTEDAEPIEGNAC